MFVARDGGPRLHSGIARPLAGSALITAGYGGKTKSASVTALCDQHVEGCKLPLDSAATATINAAIDWSLIRQTFSAPTNATMCRGLMDSLVNDWTNHRAIFKRGAPGIPDGRVPHGAEYDTTGEFHVDQDVLDSLVGPLRPALLALLLHEEAHKSHYPAHPLNNSQPTPFGYTQFPYNKLSDHPQYEEDTCVPSAE